MLVNQCSHQDREPFGCVCDHLLGSHEAEHIKRFTGMAQSYDLVCGPCSREPEKIAAALVNVCSECLQAIEGNKWQEEGIIGKPEVLIRPSNRRFEHSEIKLPELAGIQVLELQPISGGVDPGRRIRLSARHCGSPSECARLGGRESGCCSSGLVVYRRALSDGARRFGAAPVAGHHSGLGALLLRVALIAEIDGG
jgi:hypothetical protein